MLLGYGYFMAPILRGTGVSAAWVSYNARADANGAAPAEAAVNVCLFQRYDLIISR
jgi:hypothetical protein